MGKRSDLGVQNEKRISILGATGSVGLSTLDLIRETNINQSGSAEDGPFQIEVLTGNSRWQELAALAREFKPKRVAIGDPAHLENLKSAISGWDCQVSAGSEALVEAADSDADWVMAAIVGAAGLAPTLKAVEQGNIVGLANKECLVCAGDLFMKAVGQSGATLLPVDSEHNAIYQCFDFDRPETVQSVTLTASGGPFLNASIEEMGAATPAQAVAHPNWSMGAKISVDSATMMNKGLELIEAFHLFPIDEGQIDILIHPQSVVHSFVTYVDGSVLAQMGSPDMRTPIAYALAWPDRMAAPVAPLDLSQLGKLTFETPDLQRFQSLNIAQTALQIGGLAPTILNAANEVAVSQFLNGRIGFLDIIEAVKRVLDQFDSAENSGFGGIVLDSLEQVLDVDKRARDCAEKMTEKLAVA